MTLQVLPPPRRGFSLELAFLLAEVDLVVVESELDLLDGILSTES